MNSFIELWNVAISPVNIVFTVLLGLVALYWLIVVFGLIDLELLDGDGAELEGDGGSAILKFLHVGEMPISIIGSALIFCFWLVNIFATYYLNPTGSWLLGIALWVPGLMLAAWMTRLLTAPARKIFRTLEKHADAASVKVVGMVCEVASTNVDEKFGIGRIETSGAPLQLNIRAHESERLIKGDKALIISEDPETRIFKVRRYQQPKETNE